jgi:hypothetical protein
MKSSEFKKIVKSAVKEAIQEELKDILFEAFKSQTNTSQITENKSKLGTPTMDVAASTLQTPSLSLEDKRKKYEEALNGTTLNFSSNNVQAFRPQSSDPVNGSLGEGSVSMDQITSLMNTK